ncbi:uncharacterized protein SCODWIG_02268 [Saccharomycodes ludwigii]|uniref:Sporulation-specific protein 71 n=1 Tax=Saccharomycodes ludwigii TaxID=36035 RepID=A0A376B724_9ASCO|nr:hypothetical protein SCDLUD_001680 [Saccharomycodes ludwigii]KAH3901896.1 hypothetical protein SCDLUD_001680 [Saccharomycodes ludwigii]SSD60507.1 uncharacterized protein SCODWIG_02268 [Saccharomycodes ludwigii]
MVDLEKIQEIALDDEKYVNYYKKILSDPFILISDDQSNTFNHEKNYPHNIKILEIPRKSFTAFRLKYASPTEISLNSTTCLLGGVPRSWLLYHPKNAFTDNISKIFFTNLRRHLSRWTDENYVTAYEDQINDDFTRNLGYDTNFASNAQNLGDKKVHSSHFLNSKNKSKTVAVLNRNKHDNHHNVLSRTMSLDEDSALRKNINTVNNNITATNSNNTINTSNHSQINNDDTSTINVTENSISDPVLTNYTSREKKAPNIIVSSTGSLEKEEAINNHERKENPAFNFTNQNCISTTEMDEVLSVGSHNYTTFDRKLIASLSPHISRIKTLEPNPISGQKLHSIQVTNLRQKSDHGTLHRNKTLSSTKYSQTLGTQRSLILNTISTTKHYINKIKSPNYLGELQPAATQLTIAEKFMENFKEGEIIKLEKMLVMVKEPLDEPNNETLSFCNNESVETRVKERWKEYIVTARSTNNVYAPLFLQFYDNRIIPKILLNETGAGKKSRNRITKHFGNRSRYNSCKKLDFTLDSNCSVGFYNILDKSIYIAKPRHIYYGHVSHDEPNTDQDCSFQIYILKCTSMLSSNRWLTFLREFIGLNSLTESFKINIPKLQMELRLNIPYKVQYLFKIKSESENKYLKVLKVDRGYKVLQLPIIRYVEILLRKILLETGNKEAVTGFCDKMDSLLGFAWKQYDRLEWNVGDQLDVLQGSLILNLTHTLEFRKYLHYPRTIELPIDEEKRDHRVIKLSEPEPIEGFLSRLTDRYGKTTSRVFRSNYLKFNYFYTNNELLFFTSSFKALPVIPESVSDVDYLTSSVNKKDFPILEKLPQIYSHTPFPINLQSQIEWLDENLTLKEFMIKDEYAFNCASRRVQQIIKAEGLINLTLVKSVEKYVLKGIGSEFYAEFLKKSNEALWGKDISLGEIYNCLFTITMEDNTFIRFLAPTEFICNEWVNSLKRLATYWKAKKTQELKGMWDVKITNLKALNITENNEANIYARNTPKWITERAKCDDINYNITTYSMLRPLIRSGILYQKSHIHTTFNKYYVVLVPGFLMLFTCFIRGCTGKAYNTADYRHYLTIPIEDCYVYSGQSTNLDLLKRDKEFDTLNPGNHALPRVYNDGWQSGENEISRCFSLWFKSKRILAKYSSLPNESTLKTTEEEFTNNIFSNSQNSTRYQDINDTCNTTDNSVDVSDYLLLTNLFQDTTDAKCDPVVMDREKYSGEKGKKGERKKINLVSRLGVTGRVMVFMARSRQERDLWISDLHVVLEGLH